MLALFFAAALLGGQPAPDAAGRFPVGDARWAETREDGSSGCADPDARTVEIHYLATPPHSRSPNRGDIRYRLGNVSGGFILTGAGPAEDAPGDVALSGGRVHSVGVEREGVLDSFLTGRFTGVFESRPDGALLVRRLAFAPGRGGGGDAEIDVADGRLPDGTALRPFGPCAG